VEHPAGFFGRQAPSSSGDWASALSGDWASALSGDWASALSGDWASALSGHWASALSGDWASALSGDWASALSGDWASALSGDWAAFSRAISSAGRRRSAACSQRVILSPPRGSIKPSLRSVLIEPRERNVQGGEHPKPKFQSNSKAFQHPNRDAVRPMQDSALEGNPLSQQNGT